MGNVNAREMGYGDRPDGPTFNMGDIAVQVTRVHVDGLARTNEEMVMKNIQTIFKVKHFEDLVVESQIVRSRLQGNLNHFVLHSAVCYLRHFPENCRIILGSKSRYFTEKRPKYEI
jgi:hypothetical protein